MRATFVLGKIRGVRIGVHWSVLVIFALLATGLAQDRFPQAYPGRPWPLYWVAGLLAAVGFFGCLLAHELAHTLLARRNGVVVEDIVLWLLGGAARLKTEASTPAAELRVAGVGPLTSLVLGGLFALTAWGFDAAFGAGLAQEVAVWLAGINVLLAVFNAIPAAPLDGGRLLRAFLWWRTGDRLRATRMAAAAGQGFGWLLAAFGLYVFLTGRGVGGLWLVLIGWFLMAAATAEGQQAQVRGMLTGIPVSAAMTWDPVTAPVWLTADDFLVQLAYRYGHAAFPVIGADSRAAGLVTRQAAERLPARQRGSVTVADILVPLSQTTVAAPGDPLADLLPRIEPGAEHRILVLEADTVVGILSPSDITRTVARLTAGGPRRGR